MGDHLIDGQFQSDKYPTTPRNKVPLSVTDPTAQDLLAEYARRRRSVDAEFSADLEAALAVAGWPGPGAGSRVGAPARPLASYGQLWTVRDLLRRASGDDRFVHVDVCLTEALRELMAAMGGTDQALARRDYAVLPGGAW